MKRFYDKTVYTLTTVINCLNHHIIFKILHHLILLISRLLLHAKRTNVPGEVNDLNNTNNGPARTPNEIQSLQNGGSSSSNSSSVSPRHKSKRTCPETKDIDCTTDEGFWIQKQYYHALDETSKELFDSLLDKLEKIRIANEENAARKQQRLVGRNRPNKSRGFSTAINSSTQANEEKDSTIPPKQDEQTTKVN